MMTRTEIYPHSHEHEGYPVGLTAVAIALPLTIFASFLWAGLALLGVGLLSLGFGLITAALISYRYYERPAWGTAILGQFIGVCGVAVLLLVAL